MKKFIEFTTVSRPPTAADIKFGLGCRHYLNVPVSEVIGRRFITRDGLRYTVPDPYRVEFVREERSNHTTKK